MEYGAVMLIGSIEDQQEEIILHEFIRLAGDGESRIVVLADGAEEPPLFAQTDIGSIDIIALSARATGQEIPQSLEQATGIWKIGQGDDLGIFSNDSSFAPILRKRYTRGAVIADGVSMTVLLPNQQCTALTNAAGVQPGGLDLMNGLHVLSMQELYRYHMLAGRDSSLASVVMRTPGTLWIDIDPQTAVTLRDGKLAVIGQGDVLIIDVSDTSNEHSSQFQNGESIHREQVRLHTLSNGDGFDLLRRELIGVPVIQSLALAPTFAD